MGIKDLDIRERKKYTEGSLTLSASIGNNIFVLVSSYGQVNTVELNKRQVEKVIKWLQKWTKADKPKLKTSITKLGLSEGRVYRE